MRYVSLFHICTIQCIVGALHLCVRINVMR